MIGSLITNRELKYPAPDDYFSPDTAYPEYKFQHISKKPNKVYEAVRNCLAQSGLDKSNFGVSSWNPLRQFITAGSKVFILANFVYHRRNCESENEFFAKCVHGSVLRAVIDYVLLAVGEKGDVTFGNAPLQSCNWDQVLADTRADRILEFYKIRKVDVQAEDLRYYVGERDIYGRIIKEEYRNDIESRVYVDIGRESLLEALYSNNQSPRFRISDYNSRETDNYHQYGKHIYVVNKNILSADVIVSVPKLKTHEKVGITCGLKGCVGAIAQKECLAHHRFGSPKLGGDEYPQEFKLIQWVSQFHDFVNSKNIHGPGAALRIIDKIARKLSRIAGFNQAGNWYGNDTAWRMTLDIARIIKYADVSGKLNSEQQRQHIVFTDGVVGGQGEGPLSPQVVESHGLTFSNDVCVADVINSLLMGFDYNRIPLIRESFNIGSYPLSDKTILSEAIALNGKSLTLAQLKTEIKGKFIPPKGWRKCL